MIDKKNQHDVVVNAIERMKKSQFGLTGIKVELEAQLNRLRDYGGRGCDECYNGRRDCSECEGAWEGDRCDNACEEGTIYCDNCTDGYNANPVAGGDPIRCEDCEYEGYNYCEECSGSGWYSDCEYCDEGTVDCSECDGSDTNSEHPNWSDDRVCHDFILERLVPHGLAEPLALGDYDSYGYKYKAKYPLVFSKFYNDRSVDSEHTFTLAVDDPEIVFKLPEFLKIFKELGEAIGSGVFEVEGAGMHMALLNSRGAVYPATTESAQMTKFTNFRKSMKLLLPALYFLGASNEQSRGLRYRKPSIEHSRGGDKYWAINYANGAVEFRVFDTCYDSPETILDNLVVMNNCMKFWRRKYRNPGLDKITPECYFGNDMNNQLKRFYCQREHIDLLNKGLRVLKPSYLTVSDVKRQRNFSVTKTTLDSSWKKKKKEVETEYAEYEERFSWGLVTQRTQYLYRFADQRQYGEVGRESIEEAMKKAEAEADALVKEEAKRKKNLSTYVNERLIEIERSQRGQYQLA